MSLGETRPSTNTRLCKFKNDLQQEQVVGDILFKALHTQYRVDRVALFLCYPDCYAMMWKRALMAGEL